MRESFEKQGGAQERKNKLEIASISISEKRVGIPIPGGNFSALARALEAYASYTSSTSSEIRTENFNKAIHMDTKKEEQYSQNPFINKIVKDAEKAYRDENRDLWTKDFYYDTNYYYDQKGLHGSVINISFDRKNNTFILTLFSGHDGDKLEKELASDLGVERAMNMIEVKVELPDMADQDLSVPLEQRQTFRLDCAPIAAAINSVIKKFGDPKTQFNPEDLAEAFMQRELFVEDAGFLVVKLKDDIWLNIRIEGGSRFVFPTSEKKGYENMVDTRKMEGAVLVLPFPTEIDINNPSTDYGVPPKQIKNYSIVARIGGDFRRRSVRLPLHTKEQIEKARAVAEYFKKQF